MQVRLESHEVHSRTALKLVPPAPLQSDAESPDTARISIETTMALAANLTRGGRWNQVSATAHKVRISTSWGSGKIRSCMFIWGVSEFNEVS